MSRKIIVNRLESLMNEEKLCVEKIAFKETDNTLLESSRRALLLTEKEEKLASPEEAIRIEELNKEIFDSTKEYNNKSAQVSELHSKVALLENKLACSKELKSLKDSNLANLKKLQSKLNDYKIKGRLINNRLALIDENITKTAANMTSNKTKEEKLTNDLSELKQKLHQIYVKNEELNVSLIKDKIVTYENKIKEAKLSIGLLDKQFDLSASNVTSYSSMTEYELREELKKTNECLNKRNDVITNRAFERKLRFKKLKISAEQSEEEYAALCVVFWEFLNWVQEHVEVSLEEVADLFAHYFRQMVPNGSGSMVIERESSNLDEKVIPISGISINVVFSGDMKTDRTPLLSMGQQVVILLSMVFSLLKSQGIGYCVLDEIDQSLSTTHIEGLLRIISKFEHHQFLISSHNSVVVNSGNSHIAVDFKTKSELEKVSKLEAVGLTESLGDVSRRPSTSFLQSQSSSAVSSQSTELSTQESL